MLAAHMAAGQFQLFTQEIHQALARLHVAGYGFAIDLGGDDVYGYVGDENAEAAAPLLPDDGSGRFEPGSNGAPFGPFSFSKTSRQGGANLGVALHFDLGSGNDQYRSLRRSQGFGSMGVGVLYDDGGDDIYRCEAGCQGSALFGIGVQIDAGEGADLSSLLADTVDHVRGRRAQRVDDECRAVGERDLELWVGAVGGERCGIN